ncbi:TOMM system kinase/cyclase fusion protein [Calidithermus terrae]|uniref:TOMM system kinase/cyclase fusion protein n=2 Tax=Calidithermus terrae TaxID=1408545 RepID=A0A399E797_9DEIN|nr:TOMM system kinase/cyclase fusion protein [Calidithermus terrae]
MEDPGGGGLPLRPGPEDPIRGMIYSLERLEEHARALAASQVLSRIPSRGRSLFPRLQSNARALQHSHDEITLALRQKRVVASAAEWLVDNHHVLDEQLRGIRNDLPGHYYRELPKLAGGPLEGYPRVYGIAWDYVAHTDSRFDPESLLRFVQAYQGRAPLNLGELWALAISLRLVLVENLRRLAEWVLHWQDARREADRLADRLLGLRTPEAARGVLRRLEQAPLPAAFVVQLVHRLREQDPAVTPVLGWLLERVAAQGTTVDDLVSLEHARQAATNVTVSNVITSMRSVSFFDWERFVEEASLVEAALRRHAGYAALDFGTRDRYRHAVEELAKGSGIPELGVAERAVALARAQDGAGEAGQSRAAADPGYYLLGPGRRALERELRFRVPLARRFRRAYLAFATPGYLGTLALPPSLTTLLSGRLLRLSPPALHLLQLAAVAGREVAHAVLEAAVGPGLADPLDEALAAKLLLEQGPGYRFRHPLYREALYQGLSLARRAALHGEVARALEAAYRADLAPHTEALAHHYRRAGQAERALEYLLKAGERATAVYDHPAALERYREALELGLAGEARARVWERIGDAHRATGDVRQALAAYREALEGAPAPAALYRKLALTAILATDMDGAAAYLAQAQARTGPGPLERARLLLVQALYHWHWHELEQAAAEAHEALQLAEAQGAGVEVQQAYELLALSYLPMGRWEEGLRYELKRGLAGWSPEVALATDAHLCLWEYHVYGEDPYQQAQAFIRRVQEHAQAVGDLRCVAVCHYALGSMEFLRTNLQEAARHLGRALELHHRIGSPAGEAYTLAREALLRTARGELEAGWRAVERGLEAAAQAAVRDHCLMRLYAAGLWNRLEARDRARAERLARAGLDLEAQGTLCPVCSVQFYPALAAFRLEQGELEDALAYARKAQKLAETFRNQPGLAQASWVEGRALAARGELEAARWAYRQAEAGFRSLGHAYDLALVLSSLAQLPGEQAHAAEARRLLAALRSG